VKPTRKVVALALLLCAQLGWAAPSLEDGYNAFERGDIASAVQIWRCLTSRRWSSTASHTLPGLARHRALC